ncbi:uncharacterized protein LOC133524889 isoform X1 [Cydia pomonella]|uniref:uncharacterized protein LOC133524889 isoform X1 n=1 Tax=Cydia pomonella TaxID=82600 RepID=UPI002ADE7FDF|nr:uncharacterized protein LOC133524889 isoform X1 [Cydia pomonella]
MCDDTERMAACAAAVVLFSGQLLINQAKRKQKKRRWWVSSFNKSRSRYNATDMLSDFVREPSKTFENFCRMSQDDFTFLLNKIGPHISKIDTNMRQCIPTQARFAIALRFLATGDSYKSLSYLFKVSIQTVSRCVDDVCKAIMQELREEIKLPRSSHEWLEIAEEFNGKWNFPHCIGALDGKHCVMQSPIHSGSEYINYKGTFSIVLLALVDADYNFIFVDCGCQGRISDGGVYRNTEFYKKLCRSELDIPQPDFLPSKEEKMPYVFVADSAFALTVNMMKPYAGNHNKGTKERVFNYRLSRARRIVENAFGIMSSVFRVLSKPILLQPDKVTDIVMTCVLLHNFLRRSKKSRQIYTPVGIFDTDHEGVIQPGSWRNDQEGMSSLLPLRSLPRRAAVTAKSVRDKFAEYFVTNGAVSWQNNYS